MPGADSQVRLAVAVGMADSDRPDALATLLLGSPSDLAHKLTRIDAEPTRIRFVLTCRRLRRSSRSG